MITTNASNAMTTAAANIRGKEAKAGKEAKVGAGGKGSQAASTVYKDGKAVPVPLPPKHSEEEAHEQAFEALQTVRTAVRALEAASRSHKATPYSVPANPEDDSIDSESKQPDTTPQDKIMARLNAVVALDNEAKALERKIADAIEDYFMTTLQTISSLVAALQTFRHTHHAQHHKIFACYFSAIVTNIYKKLKCMEIQLEHAVFGNSSSYGSSMRAEKSQLDAIKRETDVQISRLDAKLHAYTGAGAEFDRLLSIYLKISKDVHVIENDVEKMSASVPAV
ncbi:hypothetical protein HK100_006872 [Physocladia obscura]|uniref:Uncharacterized protein n=1 Tax=Physocladia obscura TaxID=109957 RepID=A0AAD5T7I4_9FUNG|nr:hypothetical protein HK100_006872 [Physocladia obscura]